MTTTNRTRGVTVHRPPDKKVHSKLWYSIMGLTFLVLVIAVLSWSPFESTAEQQSSVHMCMCGIGLAIGAILQFSPKADRRLFDFITRLGRKIEVRLEKY